MIFFNQKKKKDALLQLHSETARLLRGNLMIPTVFIINLFKFFLITKRNPY